MDDDNEDDEREPPPTVSRLERTGERRNRVLTRATGRYRNRDRFRRLRRQLPIAEFIGRLIEHHGLTDEIRHHAVCLYWPEIIGERIASKSFPVSFAEGVLQVSASNSSWVHELHLLKAQLIAAINRWVDMNRIWLGPPPLAVDMRFVLGLKHREPMADRDHVRRLRSYHARRVRSPVTMTPPVPSESELDAIRAETSSIVDPELRALVEGVRMRRNL